jgi:hypothetical protein
MMNSRKPEVVKKKDGLMLIREDSSVRFLSVLESIKYRIGLIDAKALNDKATTQLGRP